MNAEAVRTASAGAAFWAEASPDGGATPRPITGAPPSIDVQITSTLPTGTRAITSNRGIVVLIRQFAYDHQPSAAELATAPAIPAVTLSGVASARDGRFHPRKFSATLVPSQPTYVALRPALATVRIGEAGALILSLRWQAGAAASWSIVTLTCTRNTTKFTFAAQADLHGDLIIPLTGLPPLAASQSNDTMLLTVLGDISQAGLPVSDPDALKAVNVSIGGVYAAQQSITLVRGTITRGKDLGISLVLLQPT